jgi:threonine/homoserine/homoserine lactone efflux protein
LAVQILYSACQKKEGVVLNEHDAETISLWRGFFTSFLNPKGLLMYLAILPQFISPDGNTALQALILSALFILGCGLVYSIVGLLASKIHGRKISDSGRRRFETLAGLMLMAAAVKIAMQVK